MAHPLGKHVPQTADKPKETELNIMLLVMWNWGGFAQRDFATKPLEPG